MTKRVRSHITIEGKPLCVHSPHLMNGQDVSCEYMTLASANRAKKIVQKVRHSVKVVRGECPEFQRFKEEDC